MNAYAQETLQRIRGLVLATPLRSEDANPGAEVIVVRKGPHSACTTLAFAVLRIFAMTSWGVMQRLERIANANAKDCDISSNHIAVGVGGVYNHRLFRYDCPEHSSLGNDTDDGDDTPHSCADMVWRHYGEDFISKVLRVTYTHPKPSEEGVARMAFDMRARFVKPCEQLDLKAAVEAADAATDEGHDESDAEFLEAAAAVACELATFVVEHADKYRERA